MRVGVTGAGPRGAALATALQVASPAEVLLHDVDTDRCRRVAATLPNPAEVVPELTDLLAGVHGVVVCRPMPERAAVLTSCVRARLPALCTTDPVGRSRLDRASTSALVALAARLDVPVQVLVAGRFDPGLSASRSLLAHRSPRPLQVELQLAAVPVRSPGGDAGLAARVPGLADALAWLPWWVGRSVEDVVRPGGPAAGWPADAPHDAIGLLRFADGLEVLVRADEAAAAGTVRVVDGPTTLCHLSGPASTDDPFGHADHGAVADRVAVATFVEVVAGRDEVAFSLADWAAAGALLDRLEPAHRNGMTVAPVDAGNTLPLVARDGGAPGSAPAAVHCAHVTVVPSVTPDNDRIITTAGRPDRA